MNIKTKLIICLLLILNIFFFEKKSQSFEIKNIVAINNQLITNVDLINIISFYEILQKRKINIQKDKNKLLNELIENKIKENEINTTFKSLKINDSEINKLKNQYLLKIKNDLEKITLDRKKQFELDLFYYIKISEQWNKVINYKFRELITINQNEVKKISKDKKLSKEETQNLINLEKNKSLQKISRSFIDDLKKKYLIKYF